MDLHDLGDRVHRHGACLSFVPVGNTALLFLGVPLNVAVLMKFPPMGPFMTELFPTGVRGTAQGFCYNAGRALGSFFPAMVGFIEPAAARRDDRGIQRHRLGLMIVMLMILPETRGRSLAELDGRAAVAPGD